MSSFKFFNGICKYENNLSVEEINSLKSVMRKKNHDYIKKKDKCNTVVITDKEKYFEGVKRATLDSNKYVPLNITSDKYLNNILKVKDN